MAPMRLIFMGTPMFALPTLQALIDSPHEVVAVYSQPPLPAGRGHKLTASPVHQIAEKHSIAVFTPTSLKSPEVQAEFRALDADAAIVAAYGLLLPKTILEGTRLGCINVHPSLLPRWRGAAPIPRTLMAGDTQTGVCIMQMDEGLDTGDVLLRETYDIDVGMSADLLHEKLSIIAGPLVLHALEGLDSGTITPQKQSAEGVTYAKKIEKEDCRIDWRKSAHEIGNQIRGLSIKPGAYFIFNGEMIKILSGAVDEHFSGTPGTVLASNTLLIACGNGAYRPMLMQRPGKMVMPHYQVLNGLHIPAGNVLE